MVFQTAFLKSTQAAWYTKNTVRTTLFKKYASSWSVLEVLFRQARVSRRKYWVYIERSRALQASKPRRTAVKASEIATLSENCFHSPARSDVGSEITIGSCTERYTTGHVLPDNTTSSPSWSLDLESRRWLQCEWNCNFEWELLSFTTYMVRCGIWDDYWILHRKLYHRTWASGQHHKLSKLTSRSRSATVIAMRVKLQLCTTIL